MKKLNVFGISVPKQEIKEISFSIPEGDIVFKLKEPSLSLMLGLPPQIENYIEKYVTGKDGKEPYPFPIPIPDREIKISAEMVEAYTLLYSLQVEDEDKYEFEEIVFLGECYPEHMLGAIKYVTEVSNRFNDRIQDPIVAEYLPL
jgi:hypothetical protein